MLDFSLLWISCVSFWTIFLFYGPLQFSRSSTASNPRAPKRENHDHSGISRFRCSLRTSSIEIWHSVRKPSKPHSSVSRKPGQQTSFVRRCNSAERSKRPPRGYSTSHHSPRRRRRRRTLLRQLERAQRAGKSLMGGIWRMLRNLLRRYRGS